MSLLLACFASVLLVKMIIDDHVSSVNQAL